MSLWCNFIWFLKTCLDLYFNTWHKLIWFLKGGWTFTVHPFYNLWLRRLDHELFNRWTDMLILSWPIWGDYLDWIGSVNKKKSEITARSRPKVHSAHCGPARAANSFFCLFFLEGLLTFVGLKNTQNFDFFMYNKTGSDLRIFGQIQSEALFENEKKNM